MLEGYIAKYLRISDDDEDLGANKSESDSIVNQRKVLEYYIEHHPELSKYPVIKTNISSSALVFDENIKLAINFQLFIMSKIFIKKVYLHIFYLN